MPNHNHLALFRNQFCLSQEEVGRLLGVADTTVSRFELGKRLPDIEFALGCEFLFGEPAREFFWGSAATVRDTALSRLADFSKEIEGETGDRAFLRKQFLLAIAAREDYQCDPTA